MGKKVSKTESPKTRQRRSHDGCLNCKDNRIKCDRQKPACRVCVRRGLDCSYNKRLKWLNSSIPDEEAYVPPKLDRKKDEALKTQFVKAENNNVMSSATFTGSHGFEELLPMSMNLSFDDHCTNMSASPMELSTSSQRAESSISASDVFDEIFDDTICSDYTSPASSNTNIITPPMSPAKLATPVQAAVVSTILQHYLSFSAHCFGGGLNTSMAKMFYMNSALGNSTCYNTLLALSASQLATSYPEFAQHAATYKSLALQGLVDLTRQQHSSKATGYFGLVESLRSPISSTQGLNQADKSLASFSIQDTNMMSAILCQLQLDINEPQTSAWVSHISAYRSILASCAPSGVSSLLPYLHVYNADQMSWFVNASLAKFDSFACLKTASAPIIRLSDEVIQPRLFHELDLVWGMPSRLLVLATEISYYNGQNTGNEASLLSLSGISPNVSKIEKMILSAEVSSIMQKIPEIDSFIALNLVPEDYQSNESDDEKARLSVEYCWILSIIIYYYRTVEVKHYRDPLIQTLARKILHIMARFPVGSLVCNNLSWPCWLLISLIDDQNCQVLISSLLKQFAATIKGALFDELNFVAKITWAEMTSGRYAYHEDYEITQATISWKKLVA